jgi:hypothetical protein
MNWGMTASIAALIGAPGVIFSLLNVGRQMSQSGSMPSSAVGQKFCPDLHEFGGPGIVDPDNVVGRTEPRFIS